MRKRTVERDFMDDLVDGGRWQVAIVGPRGGRQGFLMTGETTSKGERFTTRAAFRTKTIARHWAKYFTFLWQGMPRYVPERTP